MAIDTATKRHAALLDQPNLYPPDGLIDAYDRAFLLQQYTAPDPPNLSFAMGGAVVDAQAFGPNYVALVGATVAPLALQVVTVADLVTIIDTLPDSFDRSFRDDENDTGSGQLVYANTDTAAVAAVDIGSLVNFNVYGTKAWTMLVESMQRHRLAPGEEHDQITVCTGRGHLALWEEAVIYPARGTDALPIEADRVFNWTSPVFDDTAWGTATSIGLQSGTFAYWSGLPSGAWPDPTAAWIWASRQNPAYPPLDEWSPAGGCYFRDAFTVPAGVHRLHVYLTADALARLYIDGAKILDTDNGSADPTEIRDCYIDVSPGTRIFAAEVINDIDPEGDQIQNPGGLLVAIYSADANGNNIALLDHSSATWKIVEYPPNAPGMTPGEVLRVTLTEAQARGALTGWTLAFTDDVDSAGVAWPEVTDIATKIGSTYLTFIKELCVTYIDVWAQPGALVLYAWVKHGHGSDTTVALAAPTNPDAPASGNLFELSHTVLA